ncbi:hypothetical protein KBX19_02495 [Corynebacterium sp. CCUG 71335]|uniref:hypothetical protein n=1 Tax=Corynebacterium sp. CCUG 71335 TaxID=2823892 RepID=UPI002109BE65|nr:hypothetical protein [Corynebacterium sp. CCUG 71335]MCQ4619144.1 hypothetical protein [Corynebacterium pseudogenitalium]MCQ4620086.1 hypothetical protein [Corynebacterium sp. CCUG 71335]
MAVSKRAAVATAVALLLGAAGAAFGFSTVDVPTQSDAAVSVGAAPEVFIDDPDDVLSEQDEADMRSTHPDEIGHDRMADGTMIIGAGLNPRQAFGYYGDDVAAELAIDYGQRDAAVLDEMKPHVSNGEVRDQFLKNHEVINAPGGIGEVQISDDADALKNRKKLREAAQSIIYVSTAEDNINRLFNIEQGDPATRRAGLTDLREDVIQAKHTATDSGLKEDLERLERRIDELDGDPASPAFLDDFVRVLGDYRLLLEQVREKEFSDVKEYTPLPSPAIYEPNYTYSGFTTFAIMDSWHETNLQEHQRQQQAESSSTTPGVSSSGFSSAGSSSRF